MQVFPAYYERFRCIAAACPDSCCQGWDVVIDSETEAYYNTVPGAFGDKLRGALYTDSDGDRVFRLANMKKCPFWGEDKLCEIYRELGEERLCATCALFPRIRMAYEGFCEHTLALACPEAARLIVTTDDAYDSFCHTDAVGCEDYSAELMRFLLKTRQEAAALLKGEEPLSLRLEKLVRLASRAQQELTGERADAKEYSLSELYSVLEYIDDANRERVIRAAERRPAYRGEDKALTNLALYYLYRYFLGAVDTLDLLAPARFLCVSVGVIDNLSISSGDIVSAAQLYSKQIEQSYENMDRMMNALSR